MPGCVINLARTRGKVSWNAKIYNRTKIVSILDTSQSIFDSAHTNLWNFLLVGLTLYAFIALSCITSICISRFAFTKDLYQTQKFVLTPTCTRSPTFRSTKSYPPVFSVPFAQRPRPRVGARCLQGNSAFDVVQLGTIEREGAPPKVAHKLEDQHFNDCSCHTQCSLQPNCRAVIKQWVQANKNRYRV